MLYKGLVKAGLLLAAVCAELIYAVSLFETTPVGASFIHFYSKIMLTVLCT